MEISGIANLATRIDIARTGQEVGIAVKKALDVQAINAASVLQALPPVSAANLPGHLGQNVNTTA